MNKTERLQLRITPELKDKLQALADAENRSVTNYVENLIINEIVKKEPKKCFGYFRVATKDQVDG